MKGKFKIEFNKELSVRHKVTKNGGVEIETNEIFEIPRCFLRFHDDQLEFKFKVKKSQWNQLVINKKTIIYERIGTNLKKISVKLPILNDEAKEESNFTIVTVRAAIKDVLLNLFSPLKKEFSFNLNYNLNGLPCETDLYVLVPTINNQKDWYAKRFQHQYKPEDVFGTEIIKLFKNNFKLQLDKSSEDEKTLQRFLLDYVEASTTAKFKRFDPLQMYQFMIAIEDLRNQKLMEDYSLTNQNVLHYWNCTMSVRNEILHELRKIMCERKARGMIENTFVIEAPKKLPNDIMDFDSIYLTDMEDYQNYADDLYEIKDERIAGKILHILGSLILFKPDPRSKSVRSIRIEDFRKYHVQFIPNRVSTQVAQRSADVASKNGLQGYLRNFAGGNRDMERQTMTKFEWMNKSIIDNKEQQTAVKNIFNRSCFPSPYVVFGPPGTGKTSTIIEAIAQIVKLRPNSNILVTAKSNSSCDDIGNRLLKYVSINKILRIYSASFDKKPEKIDKVLEPISNFRKRELCRCQKRSCPEYEAIDDPTYEEFYTARIIITTLVNCGRFVSAGVKSNHFDFIFLDEAASESEPFTLIPISGLGSSNIGVTAQIILSGDHKQLGSIVIDKFSRKMGMEKSMMERIMETIPQYQLKGRYDPKYVTLLVNNYRSHPAILQFSNEHFYKNKLIAKCKPEIANFACGWDLLHGNKSFPLLFHSTRTSSKEVGLSLMNEGEVNVMKTYIILMMELGVNGHKINQSDIGIITPYRAQRTRIIEEFGERYPKIEVGTIDAFQGREKKIIIMSTVRSGTRHVGFLRNEKRLNVALTRAQSLLIIIGNSKTLQKCLIWNKFITYCHNNQAIVGDNFNSDIINDENYEGDEEKPEDIEDEYVE